MATAAAELTLEQRLAVQYSSARAFAEAERLDQPLVNVASFTPVGGLAALTFLHDLATSDDAH